MFNDLLAHCIMYVQYVDPVDGIGIFINLNLNTVECENRKVEREKHQNPI